MSGKELGKARRIELRARIRVIGWWLIGGKPPIYRNIRHAKNAEYTEYSPCQECWIWYPQPEFRHPTRYIYHRIPPNLQHHHHSQSPLPITTPNHHSKWSPIPNHAKSPRIACMYYKRIWKGLYSKIPVSGRLVFGWKPDHSPEKHQRPIEVLSTSQQPTLGAGMHYVQLVELVIGKHTKR